MRRTCAEAVKTTSLFLTSVAVCGALRLQVVACDGRSSQWRGRRNALGHCAVQTPFRSVSIFVRQWTGRMTTRLVSRALRAGPACSPRNAIWAPDGRTNWPIGGHYGALWRLGVSPRLRRHVDYLLRLLRRLFIVVTLLCRFRTKLTFTFLCKCRKVSVRKAW